MYVLQFIETTNVILNLLQLENLPKNEKKTKHTASHSCSALFDYVSDTFLTK